jgi:penicillin-binding protein A
MPALRYSMFAACACCFVTLAAADARGAGSDSGVADSGSLAADSGARALGPIVTESGVGALPAANGGVESSLAESASVAEADAEAGEVGPASKTATKVDALRALARARLEGEQLVAVDDQGRRIELSIVPSLQRRIAKLFAEYQVPYGALVAIEPASGRVLAYVSHSSANPGGGDLARDVSPPAASVFKLVTAAALLDRGVSADTRVCYGGGSSRLDNIDLQDDRRRDRSCASLAHALGHSINSVFAKLADRQLDPALLRRYASAFGFGRRPAFDADAPPSPAEMPGQRLEFARAAAGFWHVHMSPLQGALIASMIANRGQMPHAGLVDRVLGADGRALPLPRRPPPKVALPAATARELGRMMLRTVRDGTAHGAFYDARGRPLLPGIDVAGKTGSLSANDPYRAYSWWVGFAPADKPRIALAALVVNSPLWRIKSSFVARSALEEYLLPKAKPQPKAAKRPQQSAAAFDSCRGSCRSRSQNSIHPRR